jgi:hypothetical protein
VPKKDVSKTAHGFAASDHPVDLPAGRVLYRPIAETRYVLVGHPLFGIWLTEEGWTPRSRGVGPFRPEQALRAARLVNTQVPQGCELGPWQSGLELFVSSPLPAHANDWQRIEEDWLPPAVSRYVPADVDGVVNETCCATPADRPRVDFAPADPSRLSETRHRVDTEWPELAPTIGGLLLRPWNAHPAGSVLWSGSRDFQRDFAVVDLPAPARPTP